ncbi:MAG: PPC domain-containing protein [Ramlibacter sp.]
MLLAGCGGGSETVSSSLGDKLAQARMGEVDAANCQSGDTRYRLLDGKCVKASRVGSPTSDAVAGKQSALKSPQRQVLNLTAPNLFIWAAAHYPWLFNGNYSSGNIGVAGYGTFFYYYWPSTGNYLGELNGNIYFYGPGSDWEVEYVGALSSFTCVVYDCNSGGGGSSTGSSLTVGGSVSGATSTDGATVLHSVYLTAGVTYSFTLTSSSADPKLWLYSGSTYIDENDDISYPTNINSRIDFTPSSTGTYTLKVGFFEGFGGYTLSASSNASGGGGGGVDWSSSFSADEIVETSETLAVNGRWGQAFTVSNGELPVEIIFAAQYTANLYVTTGDTLNACVNGGAFSHYENYAFIGQYGHQSFTLQPGSYGICIRNTANVSNSMRVEFQRQPTVTGFQYLQQRFTTVVRTVQPGGRVTQPVSVGNNYRVIVDGANSGGSFWYIPATEQSAFLAGNTFSYYTEGFGCGSDKASPGLCEMDGVGEYAIAYYNDTSSPQTIVIVGRDYVPE